MNIFSVFDVLSEQIYLRNLNVSQSVLLDIDENVQLLKRSGAIDSKSIIFEELEFIKKELLLEIKNCDAAIKENRTLNLNPPSLDLMVANIQKMLLNMTVYARWDVKEEEIDIAKIKDSFTSYGVTVGDDELKCIVIRRAVKGMSGAGDNPQIDTFKKVYFSSRYFIDMSETIFSLKFTKVHLIKDVQSYLIDEVVPFADKYKALIGVR